MFRPSLLARMLLLIFVSVTLTSDGSPCSAADADPKRPNVLFLFADDLCPFDLGTYGNTEVKTPNIDRLAKRGVRFDRAYNMGSNQPAVCVASRRMLITGRALWPSVREATDANVPELIKANRLWSQRMKQAGYETYFTGKWHFNCRPHLVFDHVKNVRGGMPNAVPSTYDRPVEGVEDKWDPTDQSLRGYWLNGKHYSEIMAEDSIAYLEQAAKKQTPFFMYLSFNAPHDPRQAPKEFQDLYDVKQIAVPSSFLTQYPYRDPIGVGIVDATNRPFQASATQSEVAKGQVMRDERLAPFPRTEFAVRTHRKEYYALISHLDAQVGKILDTLEATGQQENTLIVFAADQGLAVGRHGLMGKQNMYDHSIRTPLIVAGPSIPQGESRKTPVYLQDVVPTTLDLANAKYGDEIQFHSLLPLLTKGDAVGSHYPVIYGAYMEQQRAVISGDYKLIVYPTISKVRLYNFANDPDELKDLAEDPAQKKRIQSLLAELKALQKEMSDDLSLEHVFVAWNEP